jgi:hypothetical protein
LIKRVYVDKNDNLFYFLWACPMVKISVM